MVDAEIFPRAPLPFCDFHPPVSRLFSTLDDFTFQTQHTTS